jgi:hypothetical protein
VPVVINLEAIDHLAGVITDQPGVDPRGMMCCSPGAARRELTSAHQVLTINVTGVTGSTPSEVGVFQ